MPVYPPICDFGWKAPDFTLPGTDGRDWSLDQIKWPNGKTDTLGPAAANRTYTINQSSPELRM